jgi:hypothetical protein
MAQDHYPDIAAYPGKRPPTVLPYAFRGMSPLGRDEDGWPKWLDMPTDCGLFVFRLPDEIGVPANEP